jgi:two-component system, NarL family, sensor histidine kinase DesK
MEIQLKPRDRMNYFWLVWLAYLIFFFIEPVFRRSLAFWMESLAAAAVFIALYFGYLRLRDTSLRLATLAAMFLLGVVMFPRNAGSTTFFIYAAALLPFLISSIRLVIACFAAEAALILGEGWAIHHSVNSSHFYNSVIAVFIILAVGGSNIFFAQKQRADCKLRMAHEEIEALAAVAERERIARDLHDVLGHTLSVIVLKAELAGRLLARGEDTARAQAEIADVERTARSALAEVRETIGGYRARGLAAEMDAARNALATAGVRLEIEGAPAPGSLRPAEETVLALALREAVTNIVRHAQAKTCRLRFALKDGRRSLVIEDDGRHAAAREGHGLRGMRERVESLGGTLLLEREHGTRLLIELPAAGSAS